MPKSMSRRAPSWASNMMFLLAFFGLIEVLGHVAQERTQLAAELLAPGEHVLELVGLCAVDIVDDEVLPLQDGGQMRLEVLR